MYWHIIKSLNKLVCILSGSNDSFNISVDRQIKSKLQTLSLQYLGFCFFVYEATEVVHMPIVRLYMMKHTYTL